MYIPVEIANSQYCTCIYVIQFHTVCVFHILTSVIHFCFYIHIPTFVCVCDFVKVQCTVDDIDFNKVCLILNNS
jgi:hypothetical protein